MNLASLKHLPNKSILTITDSKDRIIREVVLISGNEYVLNPLKQTYEKNRGRKVILKSLEHTKYGTIAKIKYTDTLRPGKVQIDELDNLCSEITMKNIPNEVIEDPFIYMQFIPMFHLFLEILKVIDNKKDSTGTAIVTQGEIAKIVSTSPSNVSKKLKQLIRYGAIESISPGVYKLINNSIWYTPYRIVHKVFSLVIDQPDLFTSYKEQANILDVPMDDISRAWSYINLIEAPLING